ncbi:MAG: beta-N-acetylglucosaminidase domain-containing protein [Hominisplanchenecus sp.]
MKKSKKFGIHILGLLVMLFAFVLPVSAGVKEGAGEYEIYPTPQDIVYGTDTMSLTDKVNVTVGDGIDDYTKVKIDVALQELKLEKSTTADAKNTKLIVGVYGSDDAADAFGKANGADAAVFGKYDGYTLWVKGGSIVILGKDTDAAYRGVTTLERIFEQLDGKSIRELTIKDYAEVQFRGFIEGYYGNPWSVEDRIDLMKFGGEIKMNQYVFAPKDDPYHNSKWRELYPEEMLKDIGRLAQAGNESKCFFVYALHTFMHNAVDFSSDANYQRDLQIIKDKFAQVMSVGVRQVAILEDDATGASAANIIKLLNDLTSWLHEMKDTTYPDLKTDILYCPTTYMYTSVQKMTDINAGASREVHIVVTGGKIWGEVSSKFADDFYNGIKSEGVDGRYPYMWVNWPCNDNTKTSQIMGGHNTILHTGVDGSKYEGIILNPIQESEPSKVAIFTAADFCWKTWDTESEGDQAWEDSFKYMDHMTPIESDESNALREVAKHMITQGPDQTVPGKQAQFDESVELSPKISAFTEKLNAGTFTADDVNELQAEFKKINEAAVKYLTQGTNKRMVSQMTPFLDCMRDLTQADVKLLEGLKGILAGEDGKLWENFAEAQALYEQSKTHGFNYYGIGTVYAVVGRKYITPFTEKMMKYVSDEVKKIVDPEHISLEKTLTFQIGGNTSAGSVEGTPANAMDGKPATTYLLKTDQVVGDYIGILFNIPVSVENMEFILTTSGHENDYFYEGKMEYTLDGKTWQEFAADIQPESGTTVKMVLPKAMELRGFRWKCTSLGGRNRWLGIKDINYNVGETVDTGEEKYTATFSRTSGWSVHSGPETNMTDGDESTIVWYNPSTSSKDHSIVGDYIQLDLGSAKSVGRVRAVVGSGDNDKWVNYHLEYSADGNTWESQAAYTGVASGTDTYEVNLGGKNVRYIKLINDTDVAQWVKFCEFSAFSYVEGSIKPGTAMDFTNTNDTEWRVEYGDDSAKVFPRDNVTLKKGEYIGLKFDRIHAISGITVTGTGLEKLTLEKSMNQAEWMTKDQAGAARYIRLMNKTDQTVNFSLTAFNAAFEEIHPMDLHETTINASVEGDTKNWMDGNLATKAKFCTTPSKDGYITYDLGQEINLRSLRMYVLDTAVDYPRDAKIQASVDNENWTDILTVGDGIADTDEDRDTKPVENPGGGWTHDTIDVAYAYAENANINNLKARYIRLYFTAGYAYRWVEVNEIRINGGEYIPTINDPTFVTDAALQRGAEAQNLNDRDLTTAFKPDMSNAQNGYLIYNLSDETEISRINILQSGGSISNAAVSVRTGADTWKNIGTLDKSFSSFYTGDLDQVYAIKLEWQDVTPVIYEIITLKNVGDMLEKALEEVQQKLDAVRAEAALAEKAVADLKGKVTAAASKVNAQTNTTEKLRAEVELQKLYAQLSGAEAAAAEKKASVSDLEADIAHKEAVILRERAKKAETDEEKQSLENEAVAKEGTAADKAAEAADNRKLSASKKAEQTSYTQAAANKQAELNKLENNPTPVPNPGNKDEKPVTEFNYKNVKYKVVNASAKTVAAAGVTTKKVKSVTIYDSIKYGGQTWKVIEIKEKAFKGCSKLAKVTIGKNVKKIGKEAFAQCGKLKNVNMKKAANITTIGKKAFSKIDAKAKIAVPAKKLAKYKKMLKKAGVPKQAAIRK